MSLSLPVISVLKFLSQLESTTPNSKQRLGYAIITHPFHPWKGQSFQISSLKSRKNTLSLRTSMSCTTNIPRDWTDKADPNPYKTLTNLSPILSFSHLQQLVKLITNLDQAIKEADQ
ncbi:MAG: DUF5372 family protein [Wolbachia endosymbiont of Xenopsylla cheopis]